MEARRSWPLLLGKLSLGFSLLAFLISRTDPGDLLNRLASLNFAYLTVVLVLPHVAIWISSVRWHALLNTLGVHVPLRRLFALYMIGTFFNNFLPTMVGGDVIKVYQLNRETGNTASVIAATFMERFVGLSALVSLLPLVFLEKRVIHSVPLLSWVVIFTILGYLTSIFMVFSDVKTRLPKILFSLRPLDKLLSLARKTKTQVGLFRGCSRVLSFSYLISIAFYLITTTSSWAAVRSTGAQIDIFYLIVVVPVILLAGQIPISVNGLGVIEAGYVFFLHLAGVPTLDAVAVAIIIRLRVLFTAVLGGLIFMLYSPDAGVKPGQSGRIYGA